MKKLKKYLKRRVLKICRLLDRSGLTFSARRFHELRIEIKKLHALFELISHTSKDFNLKETFRPFSQIFRQAGKVREIQIQRGILEKHFIKDSVKEYRNRLEKQETMERRAFTLTIASVLTSSLLESYHTADDALSTISRRKVNNYMDRTERSVKRIAGSNNIQPVLIHRLRKQMKQYVFGLKSLGKNEKNLADFAYILEVMGQWHDYDLFISRLKRPSGAVNSGEIRRQKISLSEVISKRQKFFKIIKARLN